MSKALEVQKQRKDMEWIKSRWLSMNMDLANENDFQNVKYPGTLYHPHSLSLARIAQNTRISACNTHTLRRLHPMPWNRK